MPLSKHLAVWSIVLVALGWFLHLPLRDVLTYPERISVLPNLETDAAAYDAFARDFADTWRISSLPSKHPPGWMVVLAVVYTVVGHSYVAGKLVSWGALLIVVACSAWLARRVFGTVAAIVAALLCASSPAFRGYVGTLQYEVLTAALFAAFLLFSVHATEAGTRRQVLTRATLAGLTAAALVLTRETFVIVVPLVAVWMALRMRARREALVAAALLLTVAAAPAVLWSAVQTIHYQRLILISEKGPKEFQLGNNPLANGTYNEPLVGMGEPAGVEFIRQSPLQALHLAGRKILYLFGILRDGWNVPHPASVWLWRATTGAVPLTIIYPIVSGGWLLAACGIALFMMRREGLRTWWLLPVTAAAILLVHVITIGSYRFAIPVLPVLYVLASGPLAALVNRILPLLRSPATAAALAVLTVIIVAAQFQRWPLSVTLRAADLDGLAAANALDPVTGEMSRTADAARGERPIALLADTSLPRGPLRVRTRLRLLEPVQAGDTAVARIVFVPLSGDPACATDVHASELVIEQFRSVDMQCTLPRDSPATLAVFTTGSLDLAVDSVQLSWGR